MKQTELRLLLVVMTQSRGGHRACDSPRKNLIHRFPTNGDRGQSSVNAMHDMMHAIACLLDRTRKLQIADGECAPRHDRPIQRRHGQI